MIEIDYLTYQKDLQKKSIDGVTYLWDSIRKKYLVLAPEELVRQLVVEYLIQSKGYNKNKISIEQSITVNGLNKRCDILLYDHQFSPILLVECKAPAVKISQKAFEQIARYNMPLKVPYLLVTNGITSYCCSIDFEASSYDFLEEIPFYKAE